jgi:hypothetical protein
VFRQLDDDPPIGRTWPRVILELAHGSRRSLAWHCSAKGVDERPHSDPPVASLGGRCGS